MTSFPCTFRFHVQSSFIQSFLCSSVWWPGVYRFIDIWSRTHCWSTKQKGLSQIQESDIGPTQSPLNCQSRWEVLATGVGSLGWGGPSQLVAGRGAARSDRTQCCCCSVEETGGGQEEGGPPPAGPTIHYTFTHSHCPLYIIHLHTVTARYTLYIYTKSATTISYTFKTQWGPTVYTISYIQEPGTDCATHQFMLYTEVSPNMNTFTFRNSPALNTLWACSPWATNALYLH